MREREEGFTLIELMVVVLIIGILVAIALPTFLGARERAQNRAAQSGLRNGLVAAKTAYTDTSDFTGADTAVELDLIEPSLGYVVDAADSTGPTVVSMSVDDVVAANDDNGIWSGAALSESGTCFYISEISLGAGAGTFYGSDPTAPVCDGDTAVTTATQPSW